MTTTVFFAGVIALAIGAIVGWVAGSARKNADTQRALAERDMARSERERSERARAEMQRRVEEAQRASAVAETQATEVQKLLANHEQLRKEIEGSFAALAQKAFKDVGESLVQTNRTQVGGALDTKKAEIETLLTPV